MTHIEYLQQQINCQNKLLKVHTKLLQTLAPIELANGLIELFTLYEENLKALKELRNLETGEVSTQELCQHELPTPK